ncbi:hypothetical protein FQR65_LT19672 [Abscondita terminalis]|nr:hypothetical protein FQR65_LT19672 [Abscondita terminalis]
MLSYAELTTKISAKTQPKITPPKSRMLYQLNFAQEDTIPQGWRIPGNNPGHIYIENGVLNIDGRANAMSPTTILLPQGFEKYKNYKINFNFTLDQPLNASRWGSVIYDVTETQGVVPTNQWYTASVVVSGQRVQHYLNHQLMQDVELDQESTKGGIGFSASGIVLKIKNIQVSEQLTALPELTHNKVTQVQEIQTHVALAPTIIQKIKHPNIALNSSNQQYYQLDAKLNLLDQTGQVVETLQHYLSNPQRKTIPVLEIKDPKSIEALKLLSKSQDISDITVLSKSDDLLKFAHQIIPMVRTALDLSRENLQDRHQDLVEIIRRSNQAYARIVVVPQSLREKASISFIQRHLMTVWVDTSAVEAQDVARVLTTGVNGVITTQSTIFSSILKQFPKNTLLRKPFIIGHRGVPSLEDENTLESAKHAHLVVMHDATVDRTTRSTGKIEEMNLAQVQQLQSKHKAYKIPTLAEYFNFLKQHPNVVLMIEMKSANPALVAKMQDEIKKYQMESQVVTTSFNTDQIVRAQTQMTEIPRGLLVGNMPNSRNNLVNTKQINSDVQKYNSSYNPAYRSDLINILEASKHRGISFWPWALSDDTFNKLYVAGTNGITTNSAQLYSKYIVDIQAPKKLSKAKVGQAVLIDAQTTQQDGEKAKLQVNNFVVLAGSPKHELKNGQLRFVEQGTAYVLAGTNIRLTRKMTIKSFQHLSRWW